MTGYPNAGNGSWPGIQPGVQNANVNLTPSSGISFVKDKLKTTSGSLDEDAEKTGTLATRTGGISIYYPLAIRQVASAHDQARDRDVEGARVAGEVLKSWRSALALADANYRKSDDDSQFPQQPGGIQPAGLGDLGGLGDMGGLGNLGGPSSLNPGDGGLKTPGIDQPDLQGPKVPGFDDPNLRNPNLPNPDLKNPDLRNPDLRNPDLRNPDLRNPNLNYPDLRNPNLENAGLNTPDLKTPDLNTPDPRSTGLADYQQPNLQTPNLRTPETPVTYTGDPGSSYGRAGAGTGMGTGTGSGLGGAGAAGLGARGINGAGGAPMMPMMPPMGAGGGQTDDKERDKDTYELREEEGVWMDQDGIAPPTLTHEV
ncbi:pentapeptide repeat-containing protein [Nonomuraea mangrovi]|uniref:Pentapeptide repeat-containing protein n=1 Tax=Nonomuraea mangrovi TaxID=2316207 RepID=A0ABW4SQ74_9ACTN